MPWAGSHWLWCKGAPSEGRFRASGWFLEGTTPVVLLPAGGTTLALPPWAMTTPTSPLPRCLLAQFSHSRIPPTPNMRLVGEAPGHPPYGHTGRLCPVGSPSELLRSQLVPSSSHCPLQGATSPPKGLRGLQVCHKGFRGLLSHGPPYPHAEEPSELLPLVSGHPAKDGEHPGEGLLTPSPRSRLRETEASAGPETWA